MRPWPMSPVDRPESVELLDRLLTATRPKRARGWWRRPLRRAVPAVAAVVDEKWVVGPTGARSARYRCRCCAPATAGSPPMPVELVKGANTELETAPLLVDLMWSAAEGAELQVAALLIGDDGRAYARPAPRRSDAAAGPFGGGPARRP